MFQPPEVTALPQAPPMMRRIEFVVAAVDPDPAVSPPLGIDTSVSVAVAPPPSWIPPAPIVERTAVSPNGPVTVMRSWIVDVVIDVGPVLTTDRAPIDVSVAVPVLVSPEVTTLLLNPP